MFSMARERDLSAYLPLVGHASDGAVVLSDGSLLGMFAAEGIPADTADPEDIGAWHHAYNLALRNLADDSVTLSIYQCRGLASLDEYPPASAPAGFAARLDRRYRDRLFDGLLYQNRLYIAFQVRPRRFAGDTSGRGEAARDATEDRLRRLEVLCEQAASGLGAYRPRRLGLVTRGSALFSEIAEAIAFALTGVWRPVGVSTGRMGRAMLSEQVIVGREAVEIRGAGRSSYAAALGLREYPAQTWPGMLGALSAAPYRSTLFRSLRFLAKADAQGVMSR